MTDLRDRIVTLLNLGYGTLEIAKTCGCYPSYVSRIKHNRYRTDLRRKKGPQQAPLSPMILHPDDPGVAGSPIPIRIPNDDPLLRRLREHHGVSLG